MSNIIDKRDEWILKLARNVMTVEPEVRTQIIRVYPTATQNDIFKAIEKLKTLERKKETKR